MAGIRWLETPRGEPAGWAARAGYAAWPAAVRSSPVARQAAGCRLECPREPGTFFQRFTPWTAHSISQSGIPREVLDGWRENGGTAADAGWYAGPRLETAADRARSSRWLLCMEPRTEELIRNSSHQLAILSSRLSRRLDRFDSWFNAIRALVADWRDAKPVWLTAPGTTAHRFMARLEDRFQLAVVRLVPFPASGAPGRDVGRHTVYYYSLEDTATAGLPLGRRGSPDRLLASLASDLAVLAVRPGGNTWQAVVERLAEDHGPTSLLLDDRLTSPATEKELAQRGAVGWQPNRCRTVRLTGRQSLPARKPAVARHRGTAIVVDLESVVDGADYLIHWTRDGYGPWPDQSDEDYLDELILGHPARQRSAVDALGRILETRRLLATRRLIRGNHQVVCFSNMTLRDLGQRRAFRRHLGRWDFERYGLAIDRTWLAGRGARPVIYGDESDWSALPADDRPFFQLRQGRNRECDWSHEREWRLPGDLDLTRLPSSQAVVFVQTAEDVERIAAWCRWPIAVMAEAAAEDVRNRNPG